MSYTKYWCFTLNNPTQDGPEFLEHLRSHEGKLSFACFQLETGDSGTRHFQGYIEFSQKQRITAVRQLVSPVAHYEPRKGTAEQASAYCRKPEGRLEGPWELGQQSAPTPGKRNDLVEFCAKLQSESLDSARASDPATFVKYSAGLARFSCVVNRRRGRSEAPNVFLLFGPPGCGKTRFFYDTYRDGVSVPCASGFWFDGYEGQESVLLDDFDGRASHWTLSNTLRVLDRYYVELPVKGGFTSWIPRNIVITTNIHPKNWFDFENREAQFEALMRRITHIKWWRSVDAMTEFGQNDVDLWKRFCAGPNVERVQLENGKFVFKPTGDSFDF